MAPPSISPQVTKRSAVREAEQAFSIAMEDAERIHEATQYPDREAQLAGWRQLMAEPRRKLRAALDAANLLADEPAEPEDADEDEAEEEEEEEEEESPSTISREIATATKEKRGGRCYELAYRYITQENEGALIHALVWSPTLKRMIGHALVETETGYIYEPVTDQYLNKESLYRTYKVKELKRYDPVEARIMVLRNKNYGPWDPESLGHASNHPLIIEKLPYPAPRDIEIGGDIGKLKVPVPPARGTPLPVNAVRRTRQKLDAAVKHLGYESFETSDSDIRTDQEVVDEAQARLHSAQVVPDEQLNRQQLAHLKLARAIAREIWPGKPTVHAAAIPPASDRVRTAGMYGVSSQAIFLSLDQLQSGRDTVDTLIHELGHHKQYLLRNSAEDLVESHAFAMTDIAARVVQLVASRRFDKLLKDVVW